MTTNERERGRERINENNIFSLIKTNHTQNEYWNICIKILFRIDNIYMFLGMSES